MYGVLIPSTLNDGSAMVDIPSNLKNGKDFQIQINLLDDTYPERLTSSPFAIEQDQGSKFAIGIVSAVLYSCVVVLLLFMLHLLNQFRKKAGQILKETLLVAVKNEKVKGLGTELHLENNKAPHHKTFTKSLSSGIINNNSFVVLQNQNEFRKGKAKSERFLMKHANKTEGGSSDGKL